MKFTSQPLKIPQVLRTAGLSSVNSAKFGMTRNNGKRAHQGIDLAVNPGYRCYAVENGKIVTAETSSSGYGMIVILQMNCQEKLELHNKFVMYAHLSQLKVAVGDIVHAGDVIGLSGDTGNAKGMTSIAKGSHLHFELRIKQIAGLGLVNRLNPLPYITLAD